MKDPFVSLGFKLAFGLDLVYDSLKANNFPLIILNLAYFPLMSLFLFLRALKNEMILFMCIFALFTLGLTAMGFFCCFAGLFAQGLGVYQQRFPSEFSGPPGGRRPPWAAEGGQPEPEIKQAPITEEELSYKVSDFIDYFFAPVDEKPSEAADDDYKQ